jgi:epoxyqueuosine reductase QueG
MEPIPSNPAGYVVDSTPPGGPLDAATIGEFLARAVATDPRNALPEGEHLAIWDRPIVGIADADDPLFAELKKPGIVGPIHRSPAEWLAGAKSVISYFLPYTRAIEKSYRIKSAMPSLEWVSARRNGEVFNNTLRRALIRFLEKHGGRGIAPSIERHYKATDMLPMWSERHAAFIAGVGSFGIHGALITAQGCAGRIGSVITDIALAPTQRAYTEIYEYCPYPAEGKCGACIPRCPVDAISVDARDNARCLVHGRDTVGAYFQDWGYHSCGHCLTHLPCADRIPDASKMRPIMLLRQVTAGESGGPAALKESN